MFMSLVTLKTFAFDHDAYLLKSKLDSEGIHSFVQHKHSMMYIPMYDPYYVKLKVPKKEADKALQVLRSIPNYVVNTDTETKSWRWYISAVLLFLMFVFPLLYAIAQLLFQF